MMGGRARIRASARFELGGASGMPSAAGDGLPGGIGYRDVAQTITRGMDMAISDDTAALVAAQLTAAWATRIGAGRPEPSRPFEDQILAVYGRIKDEVGKPGEVGPNALTVP